MMTARYVQRGDSIDYIPDHNVAAGDVINHFGLIGVAKLDIRRGELGALALTGIYEFAACGAEQWRCVRTGEKVVLDPKGNNVWPEYVGLSGMIPIGRFVGVSDMLPDRVLVRINC